MESRLTFRRCVLMVLLTAGFLAPLGCAQRQGRLAFRRFWGFDFLKSRNTADAGKNGRLTKMVPDFISRNEPAEDGSVDPFLSEDFPELNENPAGQRTANFAPRNPQSEKTASRAWKPEGKSTALTLFENPPGQSPKRPKPPTESPEGNPFRLVQHQTDGKEIASADRSDSSSASQAIPTNSENSTNAAKPSNSAKITKSEQTKPRESGGTNQLDRLKNALSQDAKTPPKARPKSSANEVARQRVEAIMKNARRQMHLGEYKSALRWASAAEQLAERSELFFGPEEDPPADLVRILQDRLDVSPPSVSPSAKAMADQSVPASPPASDTQPPQLTVEFPAEEAGNADKSQAEPPVEKTASLHSTRAMQEAVIAPKSPKPEAGTDRPDPPEAMIDPGQKHTRSLKVDARRVNANQGAVVSVEGQLNPPAETPLPKLAWAPPAEENPTAPPFEVAMTEPAHQPTTTPPPLPPPNSVKEPEPAPSSFLYSEKSGPPPEPVKNMQWDETETEERASDSAWWVFPLMGLVGVLMIGGIVLKRKRR